MNHTLNHVIDELPTPAEIALQLRGADLTQAQAETIAAEVYQPIYTALIVIAKNCG